MNPKTRRRIRGDMEDVVTALVRDDTDYFPSDKESHLFDFLTYLCATALNEMEDDGKIAYDSHNKIWIWTAIDNPKLKKLVKESTRVG